jgi:hypothetical protein
MSQNPLLLFGTIRNNSLLLILASHLPEEIVDVVVAVATLFVILTQIEYQKARVVSGGKESADFAYIISVNNCIGTWDRHRHKAVAYVRQVQVEATTRIYESSLVQRNRCLNPALEFRLHPEENDEGAYHPNDVDEKVQTLRQIAPRPHTADSISIIAHALVPQ